MKTQQVKNIYDKTIKKVMKIWRKKSSMTYKKPRSLVYLFSFIVQVIY